MTICASAVARRAGGRPREPDVRRTGAAAHHAARLAAGRRCAQPRPRRRRRSRCSRPGPSTCGCRTTRGRGACRRALPRRGTVVRPGAPGDLARNDPPAADFFAAKGVIGGCWTRSAPTWRCAAARRRSCIPGRSASILSVARRPAGSASCTRCRGGWDLDDTVAVFELDLDAFGEPPVSRYRDLTSFPEVREDLAVIVAETVTRRRGAGGGREGRRAAARRQSRCSMSTATRSASGRAMSRSRWRSPTAPVTGR